MSVTIWFTGLPGSGKTTLAASLKDKLVGLGRSCEFLDSDLFIGRWLDPAVPIADARALNDRIMALTAGCLNRHGVPCLVASTLAGPGRREEIRQILPDYVEVFCRCSPHTLRQRDRWRLYLLGEAGLLPGFPAEAADGEPPASASLVVDTENFSKEECLQLVFGFLSEFPGSRSLWAS